MQKWEYLFVEIVAEAEGTFHYRLNGADHQTDTLEWKNGKFFNDLGEHGPLDSPWARSVSRRLHSCPMN